VFNATLTDLYSVRGNSTDRSLDVEGLGIGNRNVIEARGAFNAGRT
jgi:hypothetical protein